MVLYDVYTMVFNHRRLYICKVISILHRLYTKPYKYKVIVLNYFESKNLIQDIKSIEKLIQLPIELSVSSKHDITQLST